MFSYYYLFGSYQDPSIEDETVETEQAINTEELAEALGISADHAENLIAEAGQ